MRIPLALAVALSIGGVTFARLSATSPAKARTLANRTLVAELKSTLPAHGTAATNRVNARMAPLEPGADEAKIAKLTARLLVQSHFSQRPFDDAVSSAFLDQYLDLLDAAHLVFLQSDTREFDKYRKVLDELTQKQGDTSPAYVIFKRFLERFDQQVEFIQAALKTNNFRFDTETIYLPNRRDQARPRDLAEARKMWHDRLRYEYLQEKLNLDNPDDQQWLDHQRYVDMRDQLVTRNHEEITKIITRRYTRIQRYLKEYEGDDVLQLYLTALAHVYDPHSDYMGKNQFENFNIGMKLSLFGIGAVLRSEDGYCKIVELMPGGPAEKSNKIKPNDRIICVAQGSQEAVDVVDWKLDKVVQLIRGPKGTEVRLTIIPASATDLSVRKVITLVRDEVKLEEREAKAKIIELPGAKGLRLGLIDLPSFYAEMPSSGRTEGLKSTTADVRRLLEKLKKEQVAGVILDLRRNGGGSLEEAIRLTGLFIKKGPVVQVKDPDGTVSVEDDTDDSQTYGGPLVVLTSRFSASASEILAGALQDYERALIVGDSSTHGKGTVQQLIQLESIFQRMGLKSSYNPGALKLTIRKFYRPSGASTQKKGVVPDLVLPSLNNHGEIGEGALNNALSWDTIPKAPFKPTGQVAPFLPELRHRSEERLATNAAFVFLNEEIERYKKTVADKTVSLNEARRRNEKLEAETRLKSHRRELADASASPGKVYEITLKQVDLPGLPAPLTKTNALAAATGSHLNLDDSTADLESRAEDEEINWSEITLDEAKRILADYIALYAGREAVVSTQAKR